MFIAYLLLEGFNDTEGHARAVMDLLRYNRPPGVRDLIHINLLRFNPIGDEPIEEEGCFETIRSPGDVDSSLPSPSYTRTTRACVARFRQDLERFGAKSISLRQSFGVEIDAACGQLFAQYEKSQQAFGRPRAARDL